MSAIERPSKKHIQDAYGAIARRSGSCCGAFSGCCGGTGPQTIAAGVGYSPQDLASLPEGANLGLSCGNPTALAALKPGEVVLDLGSGAGLDVFLAAQRVGATGHVHGVDMTPDMVAKARMNAVAFQARTGLTNVTFHEGHIEALPLPDASVDVVLSNCVLNLSPDQHLVWREIARVLKPGGRVSISDLVLLQPLPPQLKASVEALVGCVAGATLREHLVGMVEAAGLVELYLEAKEGALAAMLSPEDPWAQRILALLPPGTTPGDFITSMLISARKSR